SGVAMEYKNRFGVRYWGIGFIFSQGLLMGQSTASVTAESLHQYFWANYQLFNNNGAQAHTWFKMLMDGNPHMSVYKGYVTFLFGIGAYAYIVQLIPQLDARFKDDVEMQLIFAH